MKKNIFIGAAILIIICGFFIAPKTISYFKSDNFVKNILQEKKEPEKQVKILFVGDIMMDRSIRTRAERLGYDFYFSCASSTFAKYDFVVANLESTVTNYPSVSQGKPQEDYNHFRFTIDPKALIAMKKAGINVLGVDNNHIRDFGDEGIEMTRQNILDAGLNYFGDPANENYSNLRLEKNGVAFNLVSFNEFFGSEGKTLKNIEKVKSQNLQNAYIKDELIIIFSHWGDEYVETPQRVKNWAYNLINAGADVVIGMHPHVVQKTETYQNKFIAYSLGNFLFDQYFSPEVQKGGAVEIILNKEGVASSRFLNVSLDAERRPCIEE
jgi:poly-gamma-glutamate synthesis protein (capsule biosynthesis protein)